jgi:hypothetical protein
MNALIEICRSNNYPIPISLLHPEFARFQDAVRSAPLDPTLAPFAWDFATELSASFEEDWERETKFNVLMTMLLNHTGATEDSEFRECKIGCTARHLHIIPDLPAMPTNLKVENETTEGKTDGAFENILCYYEGVRNILQSKKFSNAVRKTRLPSILMLHNGKYEQVAVIMVSDASTGPNIQISAATCLSKLYIEVISPSIPLHFKRTIS